MNDVQQRAAAKHFAEYWKGKGYEKGESQKFWLSLLSDVFAVEHAAEYITFEDQVHLDHTSFIDGYIPETHVLIEQKSIDKDLKKPIKQSDGTLLTPRQQAQRYIHALLDEKGRDAVPKWVIICNFAEFHIYDMVHPQTDPVEIKLEDLPTQYYLLEFLVRKQDLTLQKEMEISIQAGELVGKLYDAFLKEYKDPTNEHSLKSLNALCVRLVFCLYAEDAGIFGKHLMFHDYMQQNGAGKARQALIDLFRVLDTPVDKRDPYLDDDLAAFPYVNGGLFSDENIEIPRLNDTILDLLLNKASAAFDWSEISPTIFGAVFESTLNPETRRSGGMHYTSIENIHKVIDPLFLDELKAELEEIKQITVTRTQEQRLRAFQEKLASLTFLDPAAGSGNFLTESYLCLRRLENEALGLLQHGQVVIGVAIDPIKVSIAQFYGIEINDFAATVAKTALWIAESQMMRRTEDIVHMELDFLPLKSYVNIVEGNALRIDWNEVVDKNKLNYIIGNPPFVGSSYCTTTQKAEIVKLFKGTQLANSIDYVGGWYYKACELIHDTNIHCAFVSTNSITQGEQVSPIWKTLTSRFGVHIDFAYRTFIWDSEATEKAHVHCVIIGFSCDADKKTKLLYTDKQVEKCDTINFYLMPAPIVFIESRATNLCNMPRISHGSKPSDGGFLILDEDEKNNLLQKDPSAEQFIRQYSGGVDFLRNIKRYCLWLKGANPKELQKHPEILRRIEGVRQSRRSSSAKATQQKAYTPTLFFTIMQPEDGYMLVGPQVSSGRRRYIPFGFYSADIIASDKLLIMPNADLFIFGVMMSNIHNAWVRAFAGRLKSDFTYSVNIVYNNFPWPEATEEQKAKIEKSAQAILDARALYPDCSLADFYDDLTMPPELRTAHQQNDRAVMEAYGMNVKDTTESSCVAELMRRYQELTA